MGSNRHRAWRLAIATAVIVGMAVTVPNVIAAGQKEASTTATAAVDGGTPANIDIAVTNRSTAGNITAQAFRVYIDTGSTLAANQIFDAVKFPSSQTGTITQPIATTLAKSSPYIEVLNANITRNTTFTLRIRANIACSDKGRYFNWLIDVRQSNDFNGTNNQIPNTPGQSLATTVTTGCALAFTAQPHNAVPNATITDTNFNPNGGPVQVAVKAADGAGPVVTDFSGNVALVANPSTTGGTLGGTTSRSVVSGVASFDDLKIAVADTYTLTASTSGATSKTSSLFTIDYGVTTSCTAGDTQACSTGTIPGPTSGTNGSVTVNDNDGLTADLAAKFNSSNIDCSGTGYVEFGDSLRVDVTNITQGSTAGLTKTVTLTKPIPDGRPHEANTDEWRYQLCFQSQENFKAIPNFGTAQENYDALLQALSNGVFTEDAEVVSDSLQWVLAPASPPAGYVEYRGLLPKCSLVSGQAPCLTSVSFGPANGSAPNGTVTFQATLKVADPMTR